MLKQLTINNFALIENLTLDLSAGLNLITGETGAGKTILVDAIGLLMGSRAKSEYIRLGKDTATVEGYFEIEDDLKDILEVSTGISIDDNSLLLLREISIQGKNRCLINGKMVPLSLYNEVGKALFDIHGQNQEQSLLSTDIQLKLLDDFGKDRIKELLLDVGNKYEELIEIKKEKEELEELSSSREREIDFLSYQINEIEKADINSNDEDELLEKERKLLINSEKLASGCEKAYKLISGDQGSAIDRIGESLDILKNLSKYDDTINEKAENLENMLYDLEEFARFVRNYSDNLDYDSDKLNFIEERINTLNNLKRKYGSTLLQVQEYLESSKNKLMFFENREEELQKLIKRENEARIEYLKSAEKLTSLRKETAEVLSEKINKNLQELHLKNALLKIDISPKDTPGANGMDYIQFMFSPNLGEGYKPLAKIASGGEVSRVMLAFKQVLSLADTIPTLVFDEIDSGVGGEAIVSVAEKLSSLSRDKQVLCVTHSPLLASFADIHYKIMKDTISDRTKSFIIPLNEEQKIDELARMLGGEKNIAGVKEQAKNLLLSAERIKKNF